MNHEADRQADARMKLQAELIVAEKQVAEGAVLLDHDQVMDRMRKRIARSE